MGNALLSGVSGLQAFSEMLDVTGNNIANAKTTAYKASSVTFADTLSSTIRDASAATANIGGTNPLQIGSGVEAANVTRDMTQGTLASTGQSLDMAIQGAGYFVVNDGAQNLYTRAGSFSVDSENFLVDSATGYRVQRTGTDGVAEGFQVTANNNIHIPYDTALPAKPTGNITLGGNLSADDSKATTNALSSSIQLMDNTGAVASETTELVDIEGATLAAGDTFTISGLLPNGAYVGGASAGTNYTLADGDTMSDLLTAINGAYPDCKATLVDGKIVVTDKESGYSQTTLNLAYTHAAGNASGAFPLAETFQTVTAGGDASRTITMDAYDTHGAKHTLTGSFVRNNANNTWDLVLTSAGDDATLIDNRVNGISFLDNGCFGGLIALTGADGNSTTDSSALKLKYGTSPDVTTLTLDLGTVGEFDGLTEFSGSSTAALSDQDGYEVGYLSGVSVTSDGVLKGSFTNGINCNLAALEMATFQNDGGLKGVGNNFYESTGNSGEAVITKAGSGKAGTIASGSLEQSNVDISTEFVNLIQAQNAFQANARTITVANAMLQELTNIIRT